MRFRLSVLSAALLSLNWGVMADSSVGAPPMGNVGNAEAGASKAGVCVACHGVNGNSANPEWPNLAGQKAPYVSAQLKLFKDGKRINPLMAPIVATLTEQDMADLGAYFATQTPAGLEADPSYWQAGEKLYRGGNPEKKIPACIACHGPKGQGNAPARYPALRAQHSVYTQKQLKDYAAGQRPGTQAAIMQTIAQRLSPEEMRDLASYIQGMR